MISDKELADKFLYNQEYPIKLYAFISFNKIA